MGKNKNQEKIDRIDKAAERLAKEAEDKGQQASADEMRKAIEEEQAKDE